MRNMKRGRGKRLILVASALFGLGMLSSAGHADPTWLTNLRNLQVMEPKVEAPALSRLSAERIALPKPYEPVKAEEDMTRRILLERFKQSAAPTPDTALAEKALKETLALGQSDAKIQIGAFDCRAIGCMADVEYPSPAAFREFERGKHGHPDLPFDRWQGTSGRTGLLVEGNRLIATWYFVLPVKP